MKHFIALYSPVMRSGKSTTAVMLTEHLFGTTISFAEPFYSFVIKTAAPFTKGGEAELRHWLQDERKDHELIPELGVTLRQMLIGVGMWGRNEVHPELWTLIAKKRAQEALRSYSVIIDDMRFPNEYDMVRSMGGLCLKVIRPDETGSTPKSEGLLDEHHFDRTIINDGSYEDLRRKVGEFCRDLSWAAAV